MNCAIILPRSLQSPSYFPLFSLPQMPIMIITLLVSDYPIIVHAPSVRLANHLHKKSPRLRIYLAKRGCLQSLSRSCKIEILVEAIPGKDLERGPGSPTGRHILHGFGHESYFAFITRGFFEQVLVYKTFDMEFPQHVLRSVLVKADQSKLFMHFTGWVSLLRLVNRAAPDFDKLICQGQRIGLLYRTQARFSRAAAGPIPNS